VGGSFAYLFESLPESLKPLEGLKDVLPREYSAASDAMNIICKSLFILSRVTTREEDWD
jgi:hypothetical protein